MARPGRWAIDLRSPACNRPHGAIPGAGEHRRLALHWLIAAIAYAGEAVAFYGLLPLGIAFVLFVLFLPWAIPWAQGGDYED